MTTNDKPETAAAKKRPVSRTRSTTMVKEPFDLKAAIKKAGENIEALKLNDNPNPGTLLSIFGRVKRLATDPDLVRLPLEIAIPCVLADEQIEGRRMIGLEDTNLPNRSAFLDYLVSLPAVATVIGAVLTASKNGSDQSKPAACDEPKPEISLRRR